MTWPDLKPFSPCSTTRLSTKSVLTPSLWSHSKPKWDLSTWSWERLNTGKVNAPELVPFAAFHGTSTLLGFPESLRAAWAKAPLVQLLQSHECVIQDRNSLSVPADHEKIFTIILVKIWSSGTIFFLETRSISSALLGL